MTEELWLECCEFFEHDANKRSRKDTFYLRGFKEGTGLYNYQAFGAFFLYKQALVGCDGGILADLMGLGKTLICLTVWLSNLWLHRAWKSVQRSWASDDKRIRERHLLKGNQDSGATCPSAPLFSISCPCVKRGISYKLAQILKPGPWLCLPPAANVEVWKTECNKWLDFDDEMLKLRLLIAYGSQYLTGMDIESLKNDKKTWAARPEQASILVISSTQSFEKRIEERVRHEQQISPRKKCWLNDAVTWGGIFHDEAHEAKKSTTIVNKYLMKQGKKALNHHVHRPFFFAVTATPYERDPMDLAGHLQALETPSWNDPKSLFASCTMSKLTELSILHGRTISALEAGNCDGICLESYTTQLVNLMKRITLRRKGDDDFFGERILNLPNMKVKLIKCCTKSGYQEAIAKLMQAACDEEAAKRDKRNGNGEQKSRLVERPKARGQGFLHGKAFDVRLSAGFPAIASLRASYPKWTLRAEDIDWDRLQGPDNPYMAHLEELVNSSSKIDKLSNLLDNTLARSRTEMENGGEKEKALILTHSPALQAIIWLWLKEYRQDIKVINYHAKLNHQRRNKIIAGFCDELNSKGGWVNAEAHEADVLLSSSKIIRTGKNLQRANVVYAFDPEWMKKDQMQAFGRVHRSGQKKDTLLYLLYDPDNPIEQKIIARQRARGLVADTSWAVSALAAKEAAVVEEAEYADGNGKGWAYQNGEYYDASWEV